MKMPKENIDTIMFANCGMNCKVCYKHCRKCQIKDCIKDKGLSYCFECSDYPCKLIKSLEKAITRDIKQALWKMVSLFANMD